MEDLYSADASVASVWTDLMSLNCAFLLLAFLARTALLEIVGSNPFTLWIKCSRDCKLRTRYLRLNMSYTFALVRIKTKHNSVYTVLASGE